MDDEYVRRTAITRLVVSDKQQSLLETTLDEYLTGAQLATNMAWPGVSSKDKLQPLAYDPIREQTDLSSQHAILATHQAAEAISGCLDRKDKGLKASKPTFTSPTITYDTRTMTLFDDHTVSLTTVESRIRCQLALPQDEDGYQWQFLNDEQWELTESTLTARDGTYFLHMGFRRHKTDAERTAEQRTAENGTVLGVDLGVENIAVTSTGTFVSGGELTHWQNEYEQRRASLQQCGTRWAHENMQSVGRKEDGRFTILVHETANTILAEARENDCTHIAFEDLTDIRERLPDATWHHRWAFRKIVEIVTYKAKSEGISVEQVNPRHTSQQCSHTDCGFTHEDNRPKTNGQDEFRCLKCGYEIHADYNAAKNIAVKCAKNLHRLHTSSGGGAPVDVRLNSGLLTVESRGTVVPR